jgi:hypothetical protein
MCINRKPKFVSYLYLVSEKKKFIKLLENYFNHSKEKKKKKARQVKVKLGSLGQKKIEIAKIFKKNKKFRNKKGHIVDILITRKILNTKILFNLQCKTILFKGNRVQNSELNNTLQHKTMLLQIKNMIFL